MKFSTSVNIERDKDKAFNYIVTANAKQTIGKIVDSFTAGIHSFCLIGSYGTGKSSFSPDLEMIDMQFDTLFFFQKRVRFIPIFCTFAKKIWLCRNDTTIQL